MMPKAYEEFPALPRVKHESDARQLRDALKRELDARQLREALFAQFRLMETSGKSLQEEFQHNAAKALFAAGINLIPSDHLADNQFVVSRGVYEAAKRLCE